MPQRRFTEREIQMLINQDGLLPRYPFKNRADECRYYARYIEKMLWRYLTPEDWKRLAQIIDKVHTDPSLKRTTLFLMAKRGIITQQE